MWSRSPGAVFPMPRSAFVLLMLCVVLSVYPHISRVPQWLVLAFAGILLWRIQVFRQRASFPKRGFRFLLVAIAFTGVVFHHGTIFGPEAGVGLLITAYLFKQLEMYTKRDAFLVVILSYFVLATEFLFSKGLFSSLYVLVVLVLITAALIALNQSDSKIAIWTPIRTALVFLLQTIPLLLLMFFLFPRIGPIWSLNLNTKTNSTGLSDRITPGDIAELSRSEKLAFRAVFDGEIPSYNDRYWRAVVFDRFDGKTWYAVSPDSQRPLRPAAVVSPSNQGYQYSVHLQPTGNDWLIAMPWANISGVPHTHTGNLMLYSRDKIDHPVSYRVHSQTQYQLDPNSLDLDVYDRYTQLPDSIDPRSRQLARTLFRRSGLDVDRFVDAILNRFRSEEFVYTLSPPTLSGDTIDKFLFDTQKGFCSHYAGATVFLLRSIGVPARMVGGYQGGASHPIGRYLLVHQYDAHAWVEYWQRGKGWTRVDPTAAVAPFRIEMGPMNPTADISFLKDSPLSPERFRNTALFSRLRLLADYVDYLWFKNVVSFDRDRQHGIFKSLLGQVTPKRIAMLIAGVGAIVFLFMAWIILGGRKEVNKIDSVDRLYFLFLKKLRKKGVKRWAGEGPKDFGDRVVKILPLQGEEIDRITSLYLDLKYGSGSIKDTHDREKKPTSGAIGDIIAAREEALETAIKQLKI